MLKSQFIALSAIALTTLFSCPSLLAEAAREGTKDRPFKLKCCDRPGAKSSVDFLSGITPFSVSGPASANVNTWSVKQNTSWGGSGGGGAQWIQPGTLAQNYSEAGPMGLYTYRWFFDAPQCDKVGVPPTNRYSIIVSGKVASDNVPKVKLDGATIASSTDMYSFMPGHELTFSASVSPSVGVHVLEFAVSNGGSGPQLSAAELAALAPASLALYQAFAAAQDPTGMSARANITQTCR